jgi:hypothetical protein
MNRRPNNQRRNRNEHTITKKVIRCNTLQRPVYEHETCVRYEVKIGSDSQKNCRTCKHSF